MAAKRKPTKAKTKAPPSVHVYGGTALIRGAKRKDGARFVGTRAGVDWWCYQGESYADMCRAFDEGKQRR